LVDSFVSFDKSLTNSEVVAELKKLSGDLNDDEDQDEHDPGIKLSVRKNLDKK